MLLGWVFPPPHAHTAVHPSTLTCAWHARHQHRLQALPGGGGEPQPRYRFLQQVATSVAFGSAAFGASANPVFSLDVDIQRYPKTARPPPPALLLPVQKVRVAVLRVMELLDRPSSWEQAISLLRSPPLSNPDFAKTLDRYSDSNWEKHILGDLYRNQGLASIKAMDEIMTFALQQQVNGVEISQEDIDDVREAARDLSASLDNFLSLAPPEDRRLVENLAK